MRVIPAGAEYHMQLIATPSMMLQAHTRSERLNWRIGDLVAKINHELFLTTGDEDMVHYKGQHRDGEVFKEAAKLFGLKGAGWICEFEKNKDGCSLTLAYPTERNLKLIQAKLEMENRLIMAAEMAAEEIVRDALKTQTVPQAAPRGSEGDKTTAASAPQSVDGNPANNHDCQNN